jgi:hypothetical protein
MTGRDADHDIINYLPQGGSHQESVYSSFELHCMVMGEGARELFYIQPS